MLCLVLIVHVKLESAVCVSGVVKPQSNVIVIGIRQNVSALYVEVTLTTLIESGKTAPAGSFVTSLSPLYVTELS